MKSSFLLIAGLILSTVATANAAAPQCGGPPEDTLEPKWFNLAPLYGADMVINVDYLLTGCSERRPQGPFSDSIYVAEPLWINLLSNQLQKSDVVEIVFLEYGRVCSWYRGNYSCGPEVEKVHRLPLSYDEPGRFSGKLSSLELSFAKVYSEGVYSRRYRQEMAVFINGRVYKEPASGVNFKFDLLTARVAR